MVPGRREGIDAASEGLDWDDCNNLSGSGDKCVGDKKGDHGRSCGEHGNGSGRVAGFRRYPSVSSSSNSISLAMVFCTRWSKSKLIGSSGIMTTWSAISGAHGENVLPEQVCKAI